MSNSLNDISPSFRDYLLRRNLSFAKTIEDNSLTSRTNGIGRAVSLSENNDVINPSQDFNALSDSYRETNTFNNTYNFEDGYGTEYGQSIASDNEESVFSVSNLEAVRSNLSYNSYGIGGDVTRFTDEDIIARHNGPNNPYLDSSGNIPNVDGGKIRDINTIASLLTGDGVGIGEDNEIIPNFDVRSSLSGRALLQLMDINDTPLGKIQHRELGIIVKNKLAAGAQREILGRVNTNPISLIKGNPFFKPNYDITVGGNFWKRLLNTAESVAGFEVPISKMSENSSIFHKGQDIHTTTLTNYQIVDTGRGQVKAMFDNLKENEYVPNYEDPRTNDGSIGEGKLTYDEKIEGYENLSPDLTSTYNTISPSPGSLLDKTKALFDNRTNKIRLDTNRIGTLIDEQGHTVLNPSMVDSPVYVNGSQVISKGSGVKSRAGLGGETDPDKVFGRVFTSDNQYGKVSSLQKHSGLHNENFADNSVLGSNGFVKVAPNYDDDTTGNMKNFMFSLENLAWDGETQNLPKSEIGPGDLQTGSKGRIMWFPPYDISIDDSTSVNWETTNFIGRGEPIYTYNNAERFGTLNFKMVIDYPSYLNELQMVSNDILVSMASGVLGAEYKNLSSTEAQEINSRLRPKVQTVVDVPEVAPDEYKVYYAHESSDLNMGYDLNGHYDNAFEQDLVKKLEDCPSCEVWVTPYYSDGEDYSVGLERGNNYEAHLKSLGITNDFIGIIPTKTGCIGDQYSSDSPCVKEARYVSVDFSYNPVKSERNLNNEKKQTTPVEDFQLNAEVTRRFINEARYFHKLKEDDPIVYENIKDKIKFFHPAFHSMTPEGFNARLNFLQQCTRQGPTRNEGRASNMAFGKAPICILRMGDFYHTKIAIDTVNITYEPLVWDMNPEGIGVQPMIANVQLSFKMIGGSSLRGPINKLQNAVSFNFFANTEVYDPRADVIVKKGDKYQYEAPIELMDNDDRESINMEPIIDEEERAINDASTDVEPESEDDMKNIELNFVSFDATTQTWLFNILPKTSGYTMKEPFKGKISIHNQSQNEEPKEVMVIDVNDQRFNNPFEFVYSIEGVTSGETMIVELTNPNKKKIVIKIPVP